MTWVAVILAYGSGLVNRLLWLSLVSVPPSVLVRSLYRRARSSRSDGGAPAETEKRVALALGGQRTLLWVLVSVAAHLTVVEPQFRPEALSVLRLIAVAGPIAIAVSVVLIRIVERPVVVLSRLGLTVLLVWQIAASSFEPRAGLVTLCPPGPGEWYVTNGGGSALVNGHYHVVSQRHALDLVKTRGGFTFDGDDTRATSYAAFDALVTAPARGVVVRSVDAFPDALNLTAVDDPRGNHVVLRDDDGRFILLAHLRRGSVVVGTNQMVDIGQPIGRVGSSGRSSEPHLHLQVSDSADLDRASVSFPIQFVDAVRFRGDEERVGEPFTVRRNDRFAHAEDGARAGDACG